MWKDVHALEGPTGQRHAQSVAMVPNKTSMCVLWVAISERTKSIFSISETFNNWHTQKQQWLQARAPADWLIWSGIPKMYNFVLDLKVLCSTLYPLKLSECQGVLLNLPFKHQACRLTQTASWDVVMRCSLSLLSIVFHCTVQLNVLANRQCVSPGALWCWIGFCGSVRSTDTPLTQLVC